MTLNALRSLSLRQIGASLNHCARIYHASDAGLLAFIGEWLGVEAVAVPLKRLFDRAMRSLPSGGEGGPKD